MTALLALFPAFESEVYGGVQETGRQAWEALAAGFPGAVPFFYSSGESRLLALVRAVKARTAVDTLLVWHLGLLKLAPFIAASRRRVLFLHGIEAWRRHDALTSRLLRHTDLFLSNSDYTWNRFLEFHPDCKTIAHRTVALGSGKPAPEASNTPGDEAPAALMLGRMQKSEDYKGHREVLAAWPHVLKILPAARLWIAGGGDLRPDLERLASELGIAHAVQFSGLISEPEKISLLRRSRAFLLPSGGEGFGLVYLEAMRNARPCLVSNLDAGREVVNPPEAGLAADPRSPEQLSAAIIRLLTPGVEWEAFSLRARRRYESSFTEHHFQQRLLAALAA